MKKGDKRYKRLLSRRVYNKLGRGIFNNRVFYTPKYRVFAQKLDGHDNGTVTFYIVESWLPAPITESDMEIQVKPDTKIKNMAF